MVFKVSRSRYAFHRAVVCLLPVPAVSSTTLVVVGHRYADCEHESRLRGCRGLAQYSGDFGVWPRQAAGGPYAAAMRRRSSRSIAYSRACSASS
jgi:hypothetical protein